MSLLETLQKFSGDVSSGVRFGFGSVASASAGLREIADKVDSGELLLVEVVCKTKIEREEFLFEKVSLKFCPREITNAKQA